MTVVVVGVMGFCSASASAHGHRQRLLQVAAPSPHPFQGAPADMVFQLGHDLADGGMKGVIAALGDHVRTRCDQVDAHTERRAFFVAPFEAHVGFLDLQPGLQADDPFFDERVQFISGPQVMVLHGELHIVSLFGLFE